MQLKSNFVPRHVSSNKWRFFAENLCPDNSIDMFKGKFLRHIPADWFILMCFLQEQPTSCHLHDSKCLIPPLTQTTASDHRT